MARRSVSVAGLSHGRTPIPTASIVGNLLVTGGVSGKDAATGQLPPDVEGQVREIFANLRLILAAADAEAEDVVSCRFWVRNRAVSRPLIDEQWVVMFPDPASRPARHTMTHELPKGHHVQAEMSAVIGGGSG